MRSTLMVIIGRPTTMISMTKTHFKAALLSATLLFTSVMSAGISANANDGLLMLNLATLDSETSQISAKVVIDAPPNVVWQSLTQYSQMKRVLPGYKKSTVLKSAGNVKTLDIGMKVSPILPAYNYTMRVTENRPQLRLDFNRIAGDFDSMKAHYKLAPTAGGKQTILTYGLTIDPGSNLPGQSKVIRSNTEKTLKALEQSIEAKYAQSLTARK